MRWYEFSVLCCAAQVPRSGDEVCGCVQNHDAARDGPLMTVPGATTYDAAELLLSFMHDAGSLPRSAVLEPLVTQAWLGNNVDLLHTVPRARGAPADIPDAPQVPDGDSSP